MKNIVLGILLTYASTGLGWGIDGHRIIAAIAENRLPEPVKAKIRILLAEELKLPERNFHEPPRGATISRKGIADWADMMRETKKSSPDFEKWHTTASWHFINIPIETESPDFPTATFCPDGSCVVTRTKELIAALTAGTDYRYGPNQEFTLPRNEVLKMVVHLIGDLHQPLHCAVWDNDRGGTLRKVDFLGQNDGPRNEVRSALHLHGVWDHVILDRLMLAADQRPLSYADALNERIKRQDTGPWLDGRLDEWAWKENRIAKEVAYHGIRPEKMTTKGSNEEVPASALDEAYAADAGKTVEMQLMRAGYRLSAILTRALAP